MDYRDYYKALGVSKDADAKEIKSAFRRLARECHPDVNPDDPQAESRFKEINEAYEVISDPEKRRKYDRLGSDWQRWEQGGGQPGGFDWGAWTTGGPDQGQRVHVRYGAPGDVGGGAGGAGAFSDFFSQMFAGMGQASGGSRGFEFRVRPQRGQDLEQEIEIDLQEAHRGTTRLLRKDGRQLEVKIPPGARDGTRVRMSGEGGTGAAGGERGDLYLRVRLRPHSQFERRGADLRVTVPVDLYTVVLGGKVQVPTLSGSVLLTVPGGTQSGRSFRLKGKGMPHLRQSEQYGDLLATLQVRVPEQLSPRQRELFEELRRSSQGEETVEDR